MSKGDSLTLGEEQEKMRMPMSKVDPPTSPKQKTQNKSVKIMVDKNTSMSNKLQNTLPNNTNIYSILDTFVSLRPLDYNIFVDMKKNYANISLFKLANIQSQRDILLHAWGQIEMDNAIFNYNVQNCLVDSGTATNIMPLSIAK